MSQTQGDRNKGKKRGKRGNRERRGKGKEAERGKREGARKGRSGTRAFLDCHRNVRTAISSPDQPIGDLDSGSAG